MKKLLLVYLISVLTGCAAPLMPLLTTGAGVVAVAEDTKIDYDKEKGLDINLALPDKDDFERLFSSSTKSQFTLLFFESSNYYLESQALLFTAYDMDVEAKKVKAALEYASNSKIAEKERMMNSIKVSTEASNVIKESMDLKSKLDSKKATETFNKALLPAGKGVVSTLKLVPAASGLTSRLTNPVSAATVAADLGALVEVLPKIPNYVSTISATMKLILSGAKAQDLENLDNLQTAIGEL